MFDKDLSNLSSVISFAALITNVPNNCIFRPWLVATLMEPFVIMCLCSQIPLGGVGPDTDDCACV